MKVVMKRLAAVQRQRDPELAAQLPPVRPNKARAAMRRERGQQNWTKHHELAYHQPYRGPGSPRPVDVAAMRHGVCNVYRKPDVASQFVLPPLQPMSFRPLRINGVIVERCNWGVDPPDGSV